MVQDALQLAAQRSVDVEIGREFRDGEGLPLMVVIPPGKFLMGSRSQNLRWWGYDGQEEPQHEVRIAHPLAVGKYPVTVGEFRRFVEATRHDTGASAFIWFGYEGEVTPGRGWRSPGFAQDDNHPVTCVNWNDAEAYIAWLNGRLGLDGRRDAYRLPSEAEWEYACRAGTTTPFSFGARISTEQANHHGEYVFGAEEADYIYGMYDAGESRRKTTPVGSFPANAFGLHDMHGNVWEWCEDCWNENYNGAPNDGSAWTTKDCSLRVLRGGSWYERPSRLRSAYRNGSSSSDRINGYGFRLARTVFTP
jgi:formylglycine-generating enzyme required for sulfatase activity